MRTLYTITVFISLLIFFSPATPIFCPLLSLVHDFVYNYYYCTQTCTHTRLYIHVTCIHNLSGVFSFDFMHACVYRGNYLRLGRLCGSLSLEETDSPSLSSHWAPWLQGWDDMEFPPSSCWHISWCCHFAGLVSAIKALWFHRCLFPLMRMGYYLTTGIMEFWFLRSFCFFLFSNILLVLGVGFASPKYQSELVTHNHLFSALWPVVDLCNGLCLWQKEILMSAKIYTYLCVLR